MNSKKIWTKVQKALKHNIFLGNNAYTFYIRVLKPVTIQNGELIVEAPNLFTINIVEKKYGDIILKEIQKEAPSLGLKFITSGDRDAYIEDSDEMVLEPVEENRCRINLDPKYTFDNFITGDCNKFAQATAWAITKNPGKSFNPFFIYGKSGIGKTHLMHAMCHEILDHSPHLKVKYVSSEQFTNELIDSIKTDRNQVFRERYRSLDVLMIDDIQFLQNKPGIQEEFFHTFNSLHSNDSQIVIASDKLPKEIQSLQERLVNRFESGVVADMAMPDLETRIAILEKKAAFEKYKWGSKNRPTAENNWKVHKKQTVVDINIPEKKIFFADKSFYVKYENISEDEIIDYTPNTKTLTLTSDELGIAQCAKEMAIEILRSDINALEKQIDERKEKLKEIESLDL